MAANVIFTNSHNTSHATIRTTPIARNTPMHPPGRLPAAPPNLIGAALAARSPGPFRPRGAWQRHQACSIACSLIRKQVAERFAPVAGTLMQAGQVEVRVGELGIDLEGLVVDLQRLGFPSRV